jgi:hypothetical protein
MEHLLCGNPEFVESHVLAAEELLGIPSERHNEYFPSHPVVDELPGKAKMRKNLADDFPAAAPTRAPPLVLRCWRVVKPGEGD